MQNDFIFAGIGEEIGLFGLTALLVVYLADLSSAACARPWPCATRSASCSPAGWPSPSGLQVFVIVGGVSGLIPLTGQTTPFLSAGGSSLMANWLLVACCCGSPTRPAGRRPALDRTAVRPVADPRNFRKCRRRSCGERSPAPGRRRRDGPVRTALRQPELPAVVQGRRIPQQTPTTAGSRPSEYDRQRGTSRSPTAKPWPRARRPGQPEVPARLPVQGRVRPRSSATSRST